MTLLILLMAAGYLVAPLFNIGRWLLLVFLCLTIAETVILYSKKGMEACDVRHIVCIRTLILLYDIYLRPLAKIDKDI